MAERVLVVEERRPVAAALRAHLEAAGFEVDVTDAAGAEPALRAEHALALAPAERPEIAGVLKARDGALPVVLLFEDDDAALAAPERVAAADAILVGPLFGPVVASVARAMARERALARRLAAPERAAAAPRDGFDFYRRLVLMEVKRARRYRYPLSLALLAVDRWTEIAPGLGATGRARLLGELLATLAKSVRDVDLPLLHTGERFLVIMPHTPSAGALQVARRLCERVAAHGGELRITASAGVASFEGEGPVSLASLITEAGRGLEAARAAGGGAAERGEPTRARSRKVDLGN